MQYIIQERVRVTDDLDDPDGWHPGTAIKEDHGVVLIQYDDEAGHQEWVEWTGRFAPFVMAFDDDGISRQPLADKPVIRTYGRGPVGHLPR